MALKIGILTSSRADYGIYQPLLKELSKDSEIEIHLIVFGMHLLKKFGYTIKQVISDNYGIIHEVDGMPEDDSVLSIAQGYGVLIQKFSLFWQNKKFDKVVALGDRYEMSAAIQASIPFEIEICHLHGGEITLGATDNIYRHQITLASKYHFVSNYEAKSKVIELIGTTENVYDFGALSLDGIDSIKLPDWEKVANNCGIPEGPFILVTVHPETVESTLNQNYVLELEQSLLHICTDYHLLITMTNADAKGDLYIKMFKRLKNKFQNQIYLIENFGRLNYFSAINNSKMLLGNTSSGILEAASFKRYVVNIGDRQKGRLQSGNVVNVPFRSCEIINAVKDIEKMESFTGANFYSKANTALNIKNILTNA